MTQWLHYVDCPETADNGNTERCICGKSLQSKEWSEADKAGYAFIANGFKHIEDQPDPVSNQRPYVWNLVVMDMMERDQLGRERYGTPLQGHNGRDALVDAYQEALDLAVYLRQAIYERDNPL